MHTRRKGLYRQIMYKRPTGPVPFKKLMATAWRPLLVSEGGSTAAVFKDPWTLIRHLYRRETICPVEEYRQQGWISHPPSCSASRTPGSLDWYRTHPERFARSTALTATSPTWATSVSIRITICTNTFKFLLSFSPGRPLNSANTLERLASSLLLSS